MSRRKKLIQRHSLSDRPGKTIENKSRLGVRHRDTFLDYADDDVVGYQPAIFHDFFSLEDPQVFVRRLRPGASHLSIAEEWQIFPSALRTVFPFLPWWSKQNKLHR